MLREHQGPPSCFPSSPETLCWSTAHLQLLWGPSFVNKWSFHQLQVVSGNCGCCSFLTKVLVEFCLFVGLKEKQVQIYFELFLIPAPNGLVSFSEPHLHGEEPLQSIAGAEIHAFHHTAHDVRADVFRTGAGFHHQWRRVVGDVKDFHKQFLGIFQFVIAACFLLVLFPLLLPAFFLLGATLLFASPSAQILQDRFGLAAVHHLLQPFVLEGVAFQVDLLQLWAVGQLRWDFGELVIGDVQSLEKENRANCFDQGKSAKESKSLGQGSSDAALL